MFTLGRKVDIHYPTNRLIAIIAILITGVGYFLTRDFSIAWKMGASVFLTWALTREIDPKREYAAFVSVFFALSSLLVVFKVDLLVVFFLLLALRYVSKITGNENTILDMLTLFGIAVFLSYSGKTSVYILVLLFALFFNMRNRKSSKMDLIFFILSIVALLAQIFILEGYILPIPLLSGNWIMNTCAISLLVFIIFIIIDKDKSILDDKGEIVNSNQILNAQIFFATTMSLLFLLTRVEIGNVIVYFASMWGYIFYGAISMLKNKKSR